MSGIEHAQAAASADRPQPRLRKGLVGAVVAVCVIVGVLEGLAAWHRHRHAALLSDYTRATTALAAMKLPAGIAKAPWSRCPGELCGYSRLTPTQLFPVLRRFTGGREFNPARCAHGTPSCPTAVAGQFRGFRIVATAFWHVIIVHGTPPRGAVRLKVGPHHLFFLGSDVNVGLTPPHL